MKIYNTLTKQKEEFVPINGKTVKIYTCGQTTYNHIHIGNARFYVVFDAIRRYLEYSGYEVQFVQNFTDIDDKIIGRANEENTTTEAIAEKYIASTLDDLQNLNVKRATVNPKATEEIAEIIEMVNTLIGTNHAYEVNGTVYYSVNSFPSYGKLSKKNIDDLEAGARVEVESGKKNPMDFVLWKPAKPGEPSWQSPWGNGRPGWHIECSAMVRKYLGDQIDIHGGGEDLTFPHHENEIAQSEAITGKTFAKYWMHCGILTVDHKKMSKSRGNFATLKDVAENFPHEVIRFYFLSGHYRMPLEFTDVVLTAAGEGLKRIKTCYQNILYRLETAEKSAFDVLLDEGFQTRFIAAMDDDFNTADAISIIFELVRHINSSISGANKDFLLEAKAILEKLMGILGFELTPPPQPQETPDENIEALINARQEARKNKDFVEADRIRDELTNLGIILEDTREGIRWHRA